MIWNEGLGYFVCAPFRWFKESVWRRLVCLWSGHDVDYNAMRYFIGDDFQGHYPDIERQWTHRVMSCDRCWAERTQAREEYEGGAN